MVEFLSRIYHHLRKEVNSKLVNEGLSMSKMKILHLITTGKTSATDIKNYMGFSSRTVVTVLDALEKEEILQRQQNPIDRRVKYVFIKGKSREKLRIAEQTHKVILDRMFAPLSEIQLEKFSEVCKLLAVQQNSTTYNIISVLKSAVKKGGTVIVIYRDRTNGSDGYSDYQIIATLSRFLILNF